MKPILSKQKTIVPKPRLQDRFDIGKYLAAGGFASVHLATDSLTGKQVVVKYNKREDVSQTEINVLTAMHQTASKGFP